MLNHSYMDPWVCRRLWSGISHKALPDYPLIYRTYSWLRNDLCKCGGGGGCVKEEEDVAIVGSRLYHEQF